MEVGETNIGNRKMDGRERGGASGLAGRSAANGILVAGANRSLVLQYSRVHSWGIASGGQHLQVPASGQSQ